MDWCVRYVPCAVIWCRLSVRSVSRLVGWLVKLPLLVQHQIRYITVGSLIVSVCVYHYFSFYSASY